MGSSKRSLLWLSAVVGLVVTLVAIGEMGSAGGRYRTRTKRIAPGVKLMKILDRRGPNRIRVLKVNPAARITLDVALGTQQLPGHETTSSMARRHRAVAAINGDFTLLPGSGGSGRPVNTFIEDGHLKASPLIWGRNFSITSDETAARVGHTRLRSWVTTATGDRWEMRATNPVDVVRDGFAMYTPAGGKSFRPPRRSCAARLYASSALEWNADLDGVSRDFVVDDVRCRYRRIKRRGGNVVTAPRRSEAAVEMQAALVPGQTIGYGWSFRRPKVLDTIGGNPDVVEGGRVVGRCEGSSFCDRHPRTGIGITRSGRILLVTVDGRSEFSVGMTPGQFGRLFRHLGAESALNLDGGGSTTMVVRGRIVNVPSGGYERPVGSALVVLPRADRGEREPDPHVTPTATPTPLPPEVPTATPPAPGATRSLTVTPGVASPDGFQATADLGCRYLSDPASTGGMLDALAKGQLGPVDDVPTSLRSALRAFRGSTVCS